jgi:hypothetical protein
MTNKSFFDALTQYRLKVEKDGKSLVDVPGIFALPGLLMTPRLSLAGLIAAPLLGLKIHVEGESGETFDFEDAVRKAAEAVKESVSTASKNIREEIDKAWEGMSADDPEECAEEAVTENADESVEAAEAGDASAQNVPEDLKANEDDTVPTVEAKPDNSAMA